MVNGHLCPMALVPEGVRISQLSCMFLPKRVNPTFPDYVNRGPCPIRFQNQIWICPSGTGAGQG